MVVTPAGTVNVWSAPVYEKLWIEGSLNVILSDWGLLLADAVPDVNAAALSVSDMLLVLFAAACAAALPVNDKVKTVPLVRVTTNVRPDGTPVTE
jgi:hypothetical protein